MTRVVCAYLIGSCSRSTDDVWVDSTPVECGRSRETAQRSDLASWTEYGYCASHSRYFWGLRPHLLCTLSGYRWPSRSPAPRPTNARRGWACSMLTQHC